MQSSIDVCTVKNQAFYYLHDNLKVHLTAEGRKYETGISVFYQLQNATVD